ncbi:MAG: hypothetical protein C0501_06485 [Isosphaera sp.]|nr:hypothetical protein [Isosphaera sp.]
MSANVPGRWRRRAVFGPGVAASLMPALLFAAAWGNAGGAGFGPTFLAGWVEFLVGPVKYWVPVLLGHPSPYALHPMTGTSTWLYGACLVLGFAHPLRPGLATGCVTAAAFAVWYGWAFLTLSAFEY